MWEIKRDALLSGLAILDMIPAKLGIPSSEFFWVRGKGSKIRVSVASYISAEVVIRGKGEWPFKGSFYIDRRTFIPFVYSARELKVKHMFQFDAKKNQLVLTHGSRRTVLDSQTRVKGYGDLRKLKQFDATTFPADEDLRGLLVCGRNCAVSDSVVPHLNCVYVSRGSHGISVQAYAASDKVFYLGQGTLEKGRIKESVPFPLFLINYLTMPGLKKISWRGNFIILSFENGWIWQPISEEALKEFPKADIVKHAEKSTKFKPAFIASSRRFSRLMTRIGYYLQSVRRKDWVVKVKGQKGKSSMVASTSIPGAMFVERIGLARTLKRDFKLEWPLDILEPVFDFLGKKTKKLAVTVRIDEKHGISYIQTGNFWLTITSRQE